MGGEGWGGGVCRGTLVSLSRAGLLIRMYKAASAMVHRSTAPKKPNRTADSPVGRRRTRQEAGGAERGQEGVCDCETVPLTCHSPHHTV